MGKEWIAHFFFRSYSCCCCCRHFCWLVSVRLFSLSLSLCKCDAAVDFFFFLEEEEAVRCKCTSLSLFLFLLLLLSIFFFFQKKKWSDWFDFLRTSSFSTSSSSSYWSCRPELIDFALGRFYDSMPESINDSSVLHKFFFFFFFPTCGLSTCVHQVFIQRRNQRWLYQIDFFIITKCLSPLFSIPPFAYVNN